MAFLSAHHKPSRSRPSWCVRCFRAWPCAAVQSRAASVLATAPKDAELVRVAMHSLNAAALALAEIGGAA